MRSLICIILLVGSNIFMTLAWYLHLQGKKYSFLQKNGIIFAILFSWGLALFEYIMQVPANKIG